MPENNAHFIDTNIWLYSLLDTGEAGKTEVAQILIKSSQAIVSTQVVTEVCANLLKREGLGVRFMTKRQIEVTMFAAGVGALEGLKAGKLANES